MNDLDALVPQATEVDFGALRIEVKPLVVRQFSPVAKALKEIPPELVDELLSGHIDVLLIAQHADGLIAACAAATDVEAKRIGELTADQLIVLLGTIFEVNADFFIPRLGPTAERLTALASRLSSKIGLIPSNGSSAPATGAPTS